MASDEAHYARKAVLSALLDERTRVVGVLKRLLVGLRRTVLGQHDKADLGRLGFGGETAREPLPLLRQAERIVATLKGDELDDILGEPLFAGVSFDPSLYYEEIRRAAEELRGVLERIGEVQREVERAYLHKKEKTKLYDRIFLREARGFADWCRRVGRDELAERIRPSSSRPGRTEKEPLELASSDLGPQIQEPTVRDHTEVDPGEQAPTRAAEAAGLDRGSTAVTTPNPGSPSPPVVDFLAKGATHEDDDHHRRRSV